VFLLLGGNREYSYMDGKGSLLMIGLEIESFEGFYTAWRVSE
jgi:hypothetical protein